MSERAAQPAPPQAGAGRVQDRFHYVDDQVLERPFSGAQLRRLLSYLAPYRRLVALGLAMTLLSTAARLAVPYLISLAIDHAIAAADRQLLVQLFAITCAVQGVGWLSGYWRIHITTLVGQRALLDLRGQLFAHLQRLSLRFFHQRPVGAVLVRVTNDVGNLQELFTNGIISILQDALTLVGIVVILLSLNVPLALACFAVLPVMFWASTGVRLRVWRAWQAVRLRLARTNAHLGEALQGVRVTQAFVQQDENMAFFSHMNEENRRAWMRAVRLNALFHPIVEVTGALGICIVFWYGAWLLRAEALTVGVLVAFASYMGNFWEPIQRLSQQYSQVLVAMASSERIFEYLDERPQVAEAAKARRLPPIKGEIRLQDVWFAYTPERPALAGIDLHIPAGRTVAFVGATGAGKTSIINLVCRFYDPDQGRVLIDGHDLRTVTLQSLRSQMGIVLQDTFLFSGSVGDNIRFGRPDATDREVEAAARAVQAHGFITALPQGYATHVEERGARLSAGQRQLISFARALLADPRILILDEATAAIDTQTELLVQEALATLLRGRTALVIAHRLSTIRRADEIVVLDGGRIAESGDHRTLIERRGLYYGLVRAQYTAAGGAAG